MRHKGLMARITRARRHPRQCRLIFGNKGLAHSVAIPAVLCIVVTGTVSLTGCASLAQGLGRDPDALWFVVHDICALDQRQFGSPSPCAEVDLGNGYVILKAPGSPTHFLLVPTARVTGIEDPAIVAPHAPNYWAQAWRARQYVEQRAGRVLERDEVGLAVNSIAGRTQHQLHIHIDCIKPAVRATLHAHAAAIGPDWAPFPVTLAGEHYLARRIGGSDLAGVNPFQLLAALPQARAAMGRETLVLTGAIDPEGRPGFILLAGRAAPDTRHKGSGEDLLDHRCALARLP
jgi:CDP-diacylglycerol pyrophosphatase